MPAASEEDITIVGEVEGDGDPALAWVQLTAGKRTTPRDRGGPLRVRLDDGGQLTVTPGSGRAALLAPRTPPRAGRWREVVGDPRAALLADAAPGDHVEVEVGGWIVPRGARVAVRGTDGEAKGGRAIVARRIALVDLDRGIAGDQAAIAELDRADARDRERAARDPQPAAPAPAPVAPRAPPVPVPWRWGSPVCLVLGAGLAMAGIAASGDVRAQIAAGDVLWPLALIAGGALLLVIALAMWASRPLHEPRSTGGPDRTFHPTWAIGKAVGAALSVQLVAGGITVSLAGALNSPWWAAATWLPVVVTSLGLTIWLAVRQRGALRFARLVLGARPLPSPLPGGAWGRFEGTVVAAGGPPLARTVRYLQESTSRTVTERQQDGTMVSRQETTSWMEGHPHGSRLAPFAIAVGDQQVAVEGGEATWAAPVTFASIGKPDGSGLAFETRAAVNDGDSVIVLARIDAGGDRPAVRGSGPESLLLFAAPTAARATLRRASLVTVATIVSLALATVGCAAVALSIGTAHL